MASEAKLMRIREGIEVAGLSDVGCQRQNNEDSYAYWEPASDAEYERKGRLAIVADGMGGHEGGQEASRIAVDAVQQVYAETPDNDPQALLARAFREAHERIHRYAAKHPELRGMGTTATAVVLLSRDLYYSHVGDSRLYLVRAGQVSRLTHDHSYVSRLVENGVISSEEAEMHPQRHILTAALGTGPEFTPDVPEHPLPLEAGDVLVLCTDGLWGQLSEHEVGQAAMKNSPAEACRVLVEMAKSRGGPDNITVQVLRLT
ncbi:MAG TPA: Stp1/IreP family PP2C-type Ser/Thr phosphatase [Terriglobales bacterium]|nr:Stp1/IreP family PP2C-type Ser/Thr phosphatase [Terriglobales bacterium]